MPNRILREGILTSARVEQLRRDGGWGAEVFYRRLLSVVDDFGRYDARPAVLKAHLYPLALDAVRESDLSRFLSDAEGAGLVRLYESNSKPHLEVTNLDDRRRAKYSKWPAPPHDSTCAHVPAYAPVCENREARGAGAPPNPPEGAAGGRAIIVFERHIGRQATSGEIDRLIRIAADMESSPVVVDGTPQTPDSVLCAAIPEMPPGAHMGYVAAIIDRCRHDGVLPGQKPVEASQAAQGASLLATMRAASKEVFGAGK